MHGLGLNGRYAVQLGAEGELLSDHAALVVGEPVDMSRVGAQAQPIRDPGPTDNVPIAVPPPSNPEPALPHAAENSDEPSVPNVAAEYFVRWLGDLQGLYEQAEESFTKPPLLAALGEFVGN